MEYDAAKIIKNTVESRNLIPKNGHVVLGLSGGPDSVCLFHVLLAMREQWKITMSAVHVNHKLRPGDAERDSAYVAKLCEDEGVELTLVEEDVAILARLWNMTDEEAGRRVRYEAYHGAAVKVAEKLGLAKSAVKIAVAQNRDDQAETVLMRLVRGTGPDGLAGIPYERDGIGGYSIIRPLLDTGREEIEEYCRKYELSPVRDHTNRETIYRRNRIRLELIPFLKNRYNQRVDDALVRLAAIAAQDKDYFDEEITMLMELGKRQGNQISFPLPNLQKLHGSLRSRLVIRCFEELGLVKNISAVHISRADELISSGITGKIAEFPSGYRMVIKYGEVIFCDKSSGVYKDTEESTEEKSGLSVPLRDIGLSLKDPLLANLLTAAGVHLYLISKSEWQRKEHIWNKETSLALDYEKIFDGHNILSIRNRKPGDWIRPSGMEGRKKIQDLFTDMKIEKSRRDQIRLITAGSEVLWVTGHRKTGNYAVEAETKQVLLIEYYT